MRLSPAPVRARTRGARTGTGPRPVMIARSGRCPWRTSRWRPSPVCLSAWPLGKAATSASTACANSARAPSRRTSVSGSENSAGWISLTTLSWIMACHSFGGEVEVSNTPTIRRLIPHAVTNFRAYLDFINGQWQNDTVYGGADNDKIYGGTNDDKLNGRGRVGQCPVDLCPRLLALNICDSAVGRIPSIWTIRIAVLLNKTIGRPPSLRGAVQKRGRRLPAPGRRRGPWSATSCSWGMGDEDRSHRVAHQKGPGGAVPRVLVQACGCPRPLRPDCRVPQPR